MKTRRLTAALAFCSLSFTGCSPGTVVRCALTDLLTPEPGPQPADTRTIAAAAETTPVPDACDAADDPAVWVDEADPEASLIVATNKLRGLVVYGLDGAVVSTNDVGRVNNVDLRDGVDVGGKETIVVAATNRTTWTIDVLSLDPESGDLTPLLDDPISPDFDEDPYGLCLYRSPATGCQATLKTDPPATSKTDPRRNGVCRSTSGDSPRSVSTVDGRAAPSRPGRKAHNCHPSRGADGVSPDRAVASRRTCAAR